MIGRKANKWLKETVARRILDRKDCSRKLGSRKVSCDGRTVTASYLDDPKNPKSRFRSVYSGPVYHQVFKIDLKTRKFVFDAHGYVSDISVHSINACLEGAGLAFELNRRGGDINVTGPNGRTWTCGSHEVTSDDCESAGV